MADAPLPFDEAIAFFRSKVRLPSAAWTDLKEGAHARGFVVAGATTTALVEDFHAAVLKAVADGRTLADFRRDFDRIVAAHGWSYKGGRGWRSAVIYNTNLRTARAAGRWAQIDRVKERRPYLRYSAILDGRTRELHRDWNGIVLRWDHKFWQTHFPPNGWNCRCTVQSVSDADLKRHGWSVTPDEELRQRGWAAPEPRTVTLPDGSREDWPTPPGIDTGFGYNVGRSWLSGAVPPHLAEPLRPLPQPVVQKPAGLPPLPAPHPVPAGSILPAGLPEADYINAFLAPFGAAPGRPVGFRDLTGHLLAVGDELFRDAKGAIKVGKRGRERYMPLLADALMDPDEIWVQWAEGRLTGAARLKRVYLKAVTLPDGSGAVSVFEWTGAGWTGVTTFQGNDSGQYVAGQRFGALLYRRR